MYCKIYYLIRDPGYSSERDNTINKKEKSILCLNVCLQLIRSKSAGLHRDNHHGGDAGRILHLSESSELLALQDNVFYARLRRAH